VPEARNVIVAVAPEPEIEQTVPPPDINTKEVVNPLEAVEVTAYVPLGKGLLGTVEVIDVNCDARPIVIVVSAVLTFE
jgi:hypothetical protein